MKVAPGPIEFPDDIGPGARLRQAREEADRSVSEISAALHIDTKTIEALEADSFDRLPGPTFVRGYMRGYARELGLPPGPILEAYERRGFSSPALSPGIVEKPQTHASDLPVRLVTYTVMAALALLVVLWWRSQDFRGLDISGDLIGWPSGSAPDPSPPATETSALAASPENGEGGVESTPGPAGEPSESPPPSSGTATTPGEAADERSPGEAGSTSGTTAEREPSTRPAPRPGATAGFATNEPPAGEDLDTTGTTAERGVSARPALRPEATAGLATDEPPAGEDLDTTGTAAERGISATPASRSGIDAGLATDDPPAGEDLDTTGTAAARGISATPASRSGIDAETGSGDIGRPDLPVPNENASPDSPSAPEDATPPAVTPPARFDTAPSQRSPGAPDTSAPPPATPGAQSDLVFDFTHESWVEIYDHDGARLFFGLVPPGRVLTIAGTPPFDVLLGYARDVRVTLDGAPFDHTPHIRHGVARFSLGAPPGSAGAPEIPSP